MSHLVYPTAAPLIWNPRAPKGIRDGLVFAGGMEHPGSTYYHDASGHDNNGTLTNMDPATDWVWEPELGRWVLDFDGSNDYVTGSPILTANENVMTLAVWIHPDAEEYAGILAKDDYPQREWFLAKGTYANLRLRLYQTNGTSRQIDTPVYSDTLMSGQWAHVGVVVNGAASSVDLYLNGSYYGDFTPTSWDGTLKNTSASPLWIAKTYANGYELDGRIADPLIYNRALTPSEIQWLASPANHLRVPWRRTVWPVVSAAATVEASLSESLAAGDSLVAALSALAAGSEGSSLGDTQAATATGRPTVSDGTALGDAAEASATLRPTEADGATLGDSQEAATTGRPSTTDGAALGDIQAAEATLRRSLVDGVIAGEQWAVRFTRAATIASGSLAGDSFQALVLTTIQSALSEGTQAGAAFAAALLAYGAITEGIRTSDAYAAMVAAVATMAGSATLGDVFAIVRVVSGAVADGALAGGAFVASLAHYVRGPYRVVAAQVHSAGIAVGQLHTAGPTAAQVHSAGIEVGQIA